MAKRRNGLGTLNGGAGLWVSGSAFVAMLGGLGWYLWKRSKGAEAAASAPMSTETAPSQVTPPPSLPSAPPPLLTTTKDTRTNEQIAASLGVKVDALTQTAYDAIRQGGQTAIDTIAAVKQAIAEKKAAEEAQQAAETAVQRQQEADLAAALRRRSMR